MSELTASDVALMNKGADDFGGNGGMWLLAILILMGGYGGNGFGNRGNVATSADIQNGFDFSSIERQMNEGVAATRQAAYDVMGSIKDASYNNLSEIRDLQSQVNSGFANMQTCCCDIKQQIMENRYLAAQNTAEINATTTALVQKVLDSQAANRMADMQNQINALQLQNAVAGVVRYPQATTYTSGANPFCACGSNI